MEAFIVFQSATFFAWLSSTRFGESCRIGR